MNIEPGPKMKIALAVLASAAANAAYIAGNGCIIAKQTERDVQDGGMYGAIAGAVLGGAIAAMDLVPRKGEVTMQVTKRLILTPVVGSGAMLAMYYLIKYLLAQDIRPQELKDPENRNPAIHAGVSVLVGAVAFGVAREWTE